MRMREEIGMVGMAAHVNQKYRPEKRTIAIVIPLVAGGVETMYCKGVDNSTMMATGHNEHAGSVWVLLDALQTRAAAFRRVKYHFITRQKLLPRCNGI